MTASTQSDLRDPETPSGPVESCPSVAGLIERIRMAQARWAEKTIGERLKRVRVLRALIAEHGSQLAAASASARSRPLVESLTAEVLPLAEACRFLERKARPLLAPKRYGRKGLPVWLAGVRSEVHREPFGVVLIIGPGNYPLLLPGVQIVQALVAGNGVLLKPGVGGSEAARQLQALIIRAGFDPDLLVVLSESLEAARAALEAGPDKVIFTGSAETGEKILERLAPRVTPAVLELSGSDAVVVRADADLDLVTRALVFGLELNGGATCMAPKRAFVHHSVAADLESRLERAFAARQGERTPAGSEEKIARFQPGLESRLKPLVTEALDQGARCLGGRLEGASRIETPLVLAGVRAEARILQQEIFASVLSLVAVADDEEAIRRVNNCAYGLGASIFTRDPSAADGMARRIQAGVVTFNDLIVPTADARLPFGGRHRSGFGVTRGAEGLLELTTVKVITVSRSRYRPAFEPPLTGDARLFGAYLRMVHGTSLGQRAQGLLQLIKSLRGRNKPSVKETQ
jgi:acyl-CoA reductase-like NAD-dependent aldehyde dehydrogenase